MPFTIDEILEAAKWVQAAAGKVVKVPPVVKQPDPKAQPQISK